MEKEILEKLDKIQKKRVLKIVVITFILSIILGSAAGVTAYAVSAKQVVYKPTDKTWKVSNVNDAIESLKLSKTGDNYKTEEQVVGTWVDGKELYQKTFTGKLPSTVSSDWAKQELVSISDMNIDVLVDFIGSLSNVKIPRFIPVGTTSGTSYKGFDFYSRFLYLMNGTFYVEGGALGNSNTPWHITIWYTKK